MKINGKHGQAVVFANVIEDTAIEQIRRMCDQPFTQDSRIRIMPDVHAGVGCTIGTTMTIRDKVVPNVVGVDIGCGMYTVQLAEQAVDFSILDEAAHYIPSGPHAWECRMERFPMEGLRCFRSIKDTRRLQRSLGTLGGGNHFIEVDQASDGTLFLVIHTGSRNLGKQVAGHYQQLAVDLAQGADDYLRRREAMIAAYKAAGRRSQLHEDLKTLTRERRELTVPPDLCWLSGRYMEDYLHDVQICQDFARRNRELIARILLERTGLTAVSAFHTVHNYIDTDEMILRKGAIAAHAGEKVLIPINMRDGAILATGLGCEDWNFSAPHGAGRVMSRSVARDTLSLDDYEKAMQGVYTTSVNLSTLDESPMAYKSLDYIIGVIHETMCVIDVIKPVYNFKASE